MTLKHDDDCLSNTQLPTGDNQYWHCTCGYSKWEIDVEELEDQLATLHTENTAWQVRAKNDQKRMGKLVEAATAADHLIRSFEKLYNGDRLRLTSKIVIDRIQAAIEQAGGGGEKCPPVCHGGYVPDGTTARTNCPVCNGGE